MSDQTTLRAETGRATGSRASRRMRRGGSVPAIVYGRGIDPIKVSVDHHDLMSIIQHSGANAIITLEIDSDPHVTMPKVIERHPFRNQIRHVDFLRISLDEATTADVHLELVGHPAGAIDGGVLTQSVGTIHVSALPMVIPTSIEADVSPLALGDSLRIEDLPAIEGVEYLDEPEMVIASVTIPRAVVEEEEVEELAEGEEPLEVGEASDADEAAEEDSGE